jgi:adenylate cyclase
LRKQAEFEPQNARVRYMAAGVYLRLGETDAGRLEMDAALRLRPDDFGALYNAACFHSLAGDTERALDLLERAASLGGYPDWIGNDPDFAPIREHPRFREVLTRLA